MPERATRPSRRASSTRPSFPDSSKDGAGLQVQPAALQNGQGAETRAVVQKPERRLLLTVEHALFLGAVVLALALRTLSLGGHPFGLGEAATALAALDFSTGLPGGAGAPLPELIAAFLFWIVGPTEATARLGSALAGSGVVALLWLARPYLGRLATLIAAYLLAISPFALAGSRQLDGEAYAAILFLALPLAVSRFTTSRAVPWLGLAAIVAGLLPLSGPRAVSYLLALVAFLLVARSLGSASPFSKAFVFVASEGNGGLVRWLFGLLAASYLVVGSRIFAMPDGLWFPAIGVWANELNSSASGGPSLPILALLMYEPLVLVFGLVGALRLAIRWPIEPRDRGFLSFLVIWMAVALLVAILGGQREVGPLFAVSLPLTLLAASALGDFALLVRRIDLMRGVALLGAIPLVSFAYFASGQLVRSEAIVSTGQWWATGLSIVLSIGYVAVVAIASGRTFAPVASLFAAFFLLMLSVHSSVALNFGSGLSEWVLSDVAGPAVTVFPEQAASIVADRGGSAAIGISPDLRIPFGWYLRSTPGLVLTSRVDQGLAAIILGEDDPAPNGAEWVVQRLVYASASPGPPQGPRNLWRWFVWRDIIVQQSTKSSLFYSRLS